VEDLLAGLIGADQQRHQRDAGGERGHQHRTQALERAAHDHTRPEAFTLEQRQVDVVADLEDAVARRDAGERDEADGAGHRERLVGNP
jgi:hypothetical protein